MFKYRLTGSGWAVCELEFESKKYSFGAGYLTDAFGNFLQALLNINPLYTEECYIESGSSFFWDDEPAGTEWNFQYLGNDRMLLSATTYDDISHLENPKVELETELSYEKFLIEVINESELLLKEFGIVGYKEMWVEHDFPLSTYLKLKY